MYSGYELSVANTMKWLARGIASIVATGILVFAIRRIINDPFASETAFEFVSFCIAAMAFVSIWRYEVFGTFLIGIVTLWLAYGLLAEMALPDYFFIALLTPAFLSLGGWMRRVEHRIISRYSGSTSTPK
jgi:hypothetical protein